MFKAWRLCECCETFVATNMLKDNHLCRTCFMQLKTVDVRLEEAKTLEQRKADAKAACEIEKLEYWWAMGEAQVNR